MHPFTPAAILPALVILVRSDYVPPVSQMFFTQDKLEIVKSIQRQGADPVNLRKDLYQMKRKWHLSIIIYLYIYIFIYL